MKKRKKILQITSLLLVLTFMLTMLAPITQVQAAAKPTSTSSSLSITDLKVYASSKNDKSGFVSPELSKLKANIYTGKYKYTAVTLEGRTYNDKTKKWSGWKNLGTKDTGFDEWTYKTGKSTISPEKYIGTYKNFTLTDDNFYGNLNFNSNDSKIQFRVCTWGRQTQNDGDALISKGKYNSKLCETDQNGLKKISYSNVVTYDLKWSDAKYKWFTNGSICAKYYELTFTNTTTKKSNKVNTL